MSENTSPDSTPSDVDTTASEPAVGPSDAPPGPETPESRQDRRDARVRAERDTLAAERDALTGRVAAMQRAEVQRRAADKLTAPADLDLIVSAQEYAACFTELGELDEGTYAALLDRVLTERPTWRKYYGAQVAGITNRSFESRGGSAPSWSGLMQGR